MEVLDHLKATGIDASDLTVDDSGYVRAVNIYYCGTRVNNWPKGLWPQSWHVVSPYDLGSGRAIYDFQITDMTNALTLGTFCHENGHMVCDYPDLYDTGYESLGVGNFCLMGYGGNADTKNPTQICAYLKNKSGWSSEVIPLGDFSEVTLSAAENQFASYTKNPGEFFIIENRAQKGRDAALPAAGLAIWHVDERMKGDSNRDEQMTPSLHYEVSLEQADGKFDLEKKNNYGDATSRRT